MRLGLLFDLDGTMADTDAAHFAAFNHLLAESGRSISPEAYEATVMGRANAQIMQALFPGLDAGAHAALADRKEALFRAGSARMTPIPGLRELLAMAVARGIPVGVVTNAPRANAAHMLHALDLAHLLPTIVVAEEIARGKPDPLPYLTGLARLSPPPDQGVAFEDSRAGITAATAAGLFTVGLRTSLDEAALLAAGADITVADFHDPALLAVIDRALAGHPLRPPA